MRAPRLLASIVLGLMAVLAALIAVVSSEKAIYDRTVENSRAIEAAFRAAAAQIDAQIIATGAPPTPQEFETRASVFTTRPKIINGMRLVLPPFPSELTDEFGAAPANAYVLRYWRGEWEEHYASWTKTSTLTLHRADFFWFGSQTFQVITMFAIALGLGFAGFFAWPRRTLANKSPAPCPQ